jgi:dipeptidyl aminopeptidase/acylaminoacyl peptidase
MMLKTAVFLSVFAVASLFFFAEAKQTKLNVSKIEYSISDGTSLTGWVSVPEGAKKLPGVILIHGGASLSDKDEKYGPKHLLEMDEVAESIGHKYAVFSVEYASKYFGDAREFESIIAAYRKFVKEPYVDPERIAFVGISHGGFLALLSSLDPAHGLKSKAVVDISGVTDLAMHVRHYENWMKKDKDMKKYDAYGVSGVKNALGWPPESDLRAKENFSKRSALTYIKDAKIPVLVIHGAKDRFVPFEHAAALVSEARKHNKPLELVEIRGLMGGHFLIASKDEVWERASAFLGKNL